MDIENLVNTAAELNSTHGCSMDAAVIAASMQELITVVNKLLSKEGMQMVAIPSAETKTEPAPPETVKPEPVTIEDLRKLVQEKVKSTSKERVVGLLSEFGASKLPELKESDYEAFKTKAEAL